MDYQKSYVLMWVGMIVGIILVAVGAGLEIGWLLGIGFVIFAAALLQTWLFFRCPHCGKLWDTRGGVPHYCPECGEYIWSNVSITDKTRPLCCMQSGLAAVPRLARQGQGAAEAAP